jgi:hypothetical protein
MKRYTSSNAVRRASALSTFRTILLLGTSTILSLPALSQTSVQPQQGQSPQQLNSDMAACANSATQASGYNPSQATSTPQPQVGGRAKGAVAGAAAGAAGAQARSNQYENLQGGSAQEQYRQNQSKSGAAAGAAAGGVKQRQARRETRQQTSAQQQAASAYDQAYKSCMGARGYLVN